MATPAPSYQRLRYAAEIITHCVRLDYRVPLSYRAVEEPMFGIRVSCETIRRWCRKFGPACAAGSRQRRSQRKDTWHLDEIFLKGLSPLTSN